MRFGQSHLFSIVTLEFAMNLSKVGTALVLGTVAAGTFWLVSEVMSQTRGTRTKGTPGALRGTAVAPDPRSAGSTSVVRSMTIRPEGAVSCAQIEFAPRIDEDAVVPPTLVASTLIEAVQVSSVGNGVDLSATPIVDNVPTMMFAWSFSIHDTANAKPRLVSEHTIEIRCFTCQSARCVILPSENTLSYGPALTRCR